MEYKSKLQADPLALILGILALTLMLLMFCCGFFFIVSLVLSIIGFVAATKSLKEYDKNREAYTPKSRENVYMGKILCLVGMILNGIIIIVFVIALFVTKSAWMNDFNTIFKEFEKNNTIQIDTTIFEDFDDVYFEEQDTIYQDSINEVELKIE